VCVLLTATLLILALLAYTYVGYPALIVGLARLRPCAVRSDDDSYLPVVTACIPVWNGAAYLERKAASLLALDYPADRLEVLLYSDGSSDATTEVADRLAAADTRIRSLGSTTRLGKPTALNAMREIARGEVLLMTDVRQPLEPGALRALVRPLADERIGCVSGNLILVGEAGAGFYWRYENRIRTAEGRFRSMVGVTGPLYAMRKADLAPLPPDVILDDMFIPMRLRLQGRRIAFARDAVAYDEAFTDEREFGRKVRTLAGQYQLLGMLPGLLSPLSNPSWFEFMSHKIMRLVCPWALIALFAILPLGWWTASELHCACCWSTRMVFGALTLAQLGFYALAVLGDRAGKLGQVTRTFVVLNSAAVVGLWRQLRGTQRVKW